MTDADSSNLKLGREIIIPVQCSCALTFSEAIFMYHFSSTDSFASVACGVFQGLLKAQSLKEDNPDVKRNDPGDFMIKVPIRCACTNANQRRNGFKYLVTYPVIKNDNTDLIARKFGVPEETIWDANKLGPFSTIFPQTTLFIPTKDVPVVKWDVPEDLPSSPRVATPIVKIQPSKKSKHLISYIFLGLGLLVVIILLIAAIFAFRSIRKRSHPTSFQLLSARSSVSSNVSPDFLDRMSKLKPSLTNFTLEELRNATEDFNEGSMTGKAVYKGQIGGSYVAIEQMNTEEAARHVIYILTKISHLNIVKLEGCCYGTNPYLVFEFAEYGSLRDCLSNANVARQLTWAKRTQIAFDLAVGLHYIHYCTKPSFIHHNIHSRNVLITTDCRAKITGFTLAKPVNSSEENGEISWNESVIVGRKGYLAPEYLTYGLASLKLDVFAFGVVLLELLSAKEAAADGLFLKNPVISFEDAGHECSLGYLEKLKEFMDPVLEGKYPLVDAMCLAFLAKACVEQDPHHRPTMDKL
ncbi:PREDICTED: protein LYK5 [Theobroma cacao]|uniref:Protein LYK5 n=1 Tax=Theobroma cacao TaxID=3641 RepID=A0AB32W353_THECC|nr:PREDICTED: protein LYK5 [Theobroma cacao]